MRQEKKTCSFCGTELMTFEDPNASAESLAYGSNDAGLKFPEHNNKDGNRCKGSGVVLQ